MGWWTRDLLVPPTAEQRRTSPPVVPRAEPDHYLKIGWFHDPEDAARKKMTVEFYLESKSDAHTVLKIVHSGFSRATKWAEEYDAHSRGWLWELTSMANSRQHPRRSVLDHDGARRPVRRTVLLNQAPTEFAGTVDNMDHTMLRFGIETYLRRPEASFWLSTWGDRDRRETLQTRWTRTFGRLFGEAESD